MKFTIFGASGFVGRNLKSYILSKGHKVSSISRNEEYPSSCSLGHVFYCIGLTANFRGRPFATVEAHVCLLKIILSEGNFESLTYLSSTRIYEGARETDENAKLTVSPFMPGHLYNISKIMGESLCINSRRNTKVVRISNIVGIDMPEGNFISQLLLEAKEFQKVTFLTSPESAKDYVAISDVLRWLFKIALTGHHRVYNIASGVNISNLEIANILNKNNIKTNFLKGAPTWKFPVIDTALLNVEHGFSTKKLDIEFNSIMSLLTNEIGGKNG